MTSGGNGSSILGSDSLTGRGCCGCNVASAELLESVTRGLPRARRVLRGWARSLVPRGFSRTNPSSPRMARFWAGRDDSVAGERKDEAEDAAIDEAIEEYEEEKMAEEGVDE